MKKTTKVIIIWVIILIIVIGIVVLLVIRHRSNQERSGVPESESMETLLPDADVFDSEDPIVPSSSDSANAVTNADNNAPDEQDETGEKPSDVQEDQPEEYFLPEDYFD